MCEENVTVFGTWKQNTSAVCFVDAILEAVEVSVSFFLPPLVSVSIAYFVQLADLFTKAFKLNCNLNIAVQCMGWK